MNDLNIITEHINKRNFDVALKHCDDLENTKNAFLINNFTLSWYCRSDSISNISSSISCEMGDSPIVALNLGI